MFCNDSKYTVQLDSHEKAVFYCLDFSSCNRKLVYNPENPAGYNPKYNMFDRQLSCIVNTSYKMKVRSLKVFCKDSAKMFQFLHETLRF